MLENEQKCIFNPHIKIYSMIYKRSNGQIIAQKQNYYIRPKKVTDLTCKNTYLSFHRNITVLQVQKRQI